ncbi:hypothetical protein K503DRAFT_765059 [Rhizopogon vinicolor AM-OR11-026]|uniref:Uncharacterized protein n=1 Tax=Rhizopogon vinicolor AM-OR11-026 TaxID=1314800 RepID=A0A1B7NI60_9AGAM|nr:hypothetical protein K503DRAFT_765059 [Rhizopogon vinicolor AM-OR11-026]
MASPTSPIFQGVLEPFEESQGAGVFDRPHVARHHELEQRSHMQPQRKLSRKSLWHRKSTKKQQPPPTQEDIMDSKANDTSDEELADLNLFSPSLSRSIIPDPLRELPTWYKKESDMAAANISSFRIKYPLHNPVGPKWYQNHHLIPPALLNPGNRPPSVFSPSFPPMAPSLHDRSQDSTRLPGPSRTPSATTLQTPSSSLPELAGKPRSRKTSQDNADLLDASDPWGTHWHHQSPYDTTPVSIDSPDRSRSRLSSMNTAPTPTRRKTVTPSPLSQSTSALNPQPPEPTVTRKLSKHRKPVLGNLFGSHDKGADSSSKSITPQRASTIAGSSLQVPNSSASRNSTLSPTSVPQNASTAALSTHSSTTKERRTSVLGRLVRKFSILKKSTQDAGPTISERDDELHSEPRRSFVSQRQTSPEKPSMEKKHSDPSKRVPPPRIDLEPVSNVTGRGPSAELEPEINDHRSSISYEVPFSPGKLTIANPDAPSSGGTTPIRLSMALPPEDFSMPQPDSKHQFVDTPQSQPVQSRHEQKESTYPASNGKTSPVKRVTPVAASSSSPSVLRSVPPQLPNIQSQPFFPSFSAPSVTIPTAPATTEIRMLHAFSIATSAITSTSNDSPLSKASVLVNPPTPYDYDTNELQLHPDLPTDVPKVAQIERVPNKASSRENSPVKKSDGEVVRVAKSNSTTSRKTETFRLMRNPSDKAPSSGETITAEGEHWTVVNSSDAPRRRRTREKVEKNERVERVEKRSSTKDRESRREQRRQEKAVQEAAENHRRATSQGRTKQAQVEAVDSNSARPSRSRSFDTTPRSSVVQPMVFTLHTEPPRHRKSDDRPRDSHHSKPTRPSPVSGIAHVERLPSTATRPTSEMTSTADINALRAREAWEMDRLWKGRSMYHAHPEANVIASPSSTRNSRHVNAEFIVDASGHGSSHTSYLVQPLQAHPMPASVFYANMPSAPPPIIYTATSPYGQAPQGGHQPSYRSLPNSFTFPSTENPSGDSTTRPNPLPRPPRQSTYQPAHLPVLSDRGSGPVSEYWTNKYPPVPSHG